MVAGGISYYGLSDLYLLNGTMSNFSYSQLLEHYKKNYEEFKNENKNIYFEQDGARDHTSKENKKLLNSLFKKKMDSKLPKFP